MPGAPPTTPLPTFLTLSEVSKLLKCDEPRLRALIREGQLRVVALDNRGGWDTLRVSERDYIDFVERRSRVGKDTAKQAAAAVRWSKANPIHTLPERPRP